MYWRYNTCSTPWPIEKASCDPRGIAVFSMVLLIRAGVYWRHWALRADRSNAKEDRKYIYSTYFY